MSLLQNIEGCHQMIKELLVSVERLMLRVKELESKINHNCRTSSRLPSSLMYRKDTAFPRYKGINLFNRLRKQKQAVLAFTFHTKAAFTNIQEERDIRPTKTKIKVSECFRTEFAAKIYAHIQSFVSIVRKLQFNPLNELYTVLSGGTTEYRAKTC